jgi:hypothetical protein
MDSKRTLIIVPVLKDKGNLTTLIGELARELTDRTAISMLVVDDGSIPPIDLVDVRALEGQVITLSRNLGHQKATAIGLAHAVSQSLASRRLGCRSDQTVRIQTKCTVSPRGKSHAGVNRPTIDQSA